MGLTLLWLDLETTGLDPDSCSILEIAAVLEVEKRRTVVIDGFVPNKWEGRVPSFEQAAFAMHAESGLLKTLAETIVHGTFLKDPENVLLDALANAGPVTLAGNSVHFDRAFLRMHMPRLDKRLHYRHLDVSCLTTFFEENFGWERSKAAKPHRAMEDVNHSIATYDRYVSALQNGAGVVRGGHGIV